MKFTCTTEISRPLAEVVSLFKDPANLKYYQDGFLKKELISGTEGEVGAVSRLYYKMGKREMELTETILVNNLPEEFLGSYHHKHMDNTMRCHFMPLDEKSTAYTTIIDYTAFRGFLPKMMALLFPGMFKKQVQKWLDNFKAFAEENGK